MIYSPSSRTDFSFCNRFWWLRKKRRVTPKTIDYAELCSMGGSAVGVGMELWNKHLINGMEAALVGLQSAAITNLNDAFIEAEQLGRTVALPKDIEFRSSLPGLISKAVEVLWNENPLKKYAILGAEEVYTQAGDARCDVRVKNAEGRQIIWDYKVKFKEGFAEAWVPAELQKHLDGDQRLTYSTFGNVDLFGIILVVVDAADRNKKKLGPKVYTAMRPVTDHEKRVWLRDAQLMSSQMAQTLLIEDPRLVMGRPYPHASQYGECKYAKACLDYDLDEEKMRLDYIQIEKKEVPDVAE